MDGFKNSTRMKYMCGGPVRKATGGVIKSAAPKGASNALTMAPKGGAPKAAKTTGAAASLSSALGTLSAASKTPKSAAPKSEAKSAAETKMGVMPTDLVKKGASPTGPLGSVRKPNVQPTPPKDVKTIGGAPKSAKTVGGEPRRSNEGISAKQLLAGTAGDYAAPPKDAGREAARPEMAPKNAKTMGNAVQKAQTMAAASREAKTMGNAVQKAQTMGAASRDAKTMAKKGVPVASNKPMVGFKGGGYVSKSAFKW